jgi:integrase
VVSGRLGERTDGPVFLATDGRRLDRHGAGRVVRKVARRAGVGKAVTPHTLRHAFITAAQGRGVASDATFRRRREAGAVRAADSGPPRPQPAMGEKAQFRQVHEGEVAAGDWMCHRVLLHRKTA